MVDQVTLRRIITPGSVKVPPCRQIYYHRNNSKLIMHKLLAGLWISRRWWLWGMGHHTSRTNNPKKESHPFFLNFLSLRLLRKVELILVRLQRMRRMVQLPSSQYYFQVLAKILWVWILSRRHKICGNLCNRIGLLGRRPLLQRDLRELKCPPHLHQPNPKIKQPDKIFWVIQINLLCFPKRVAPIVRLSRVFWMLPLLTIRY